MTSINRYGRIGAALVSALALVSLSACGESAVEEDTASGDTASSSDTLVFAAVPSEESSSLDASHELVLQVLEDELGVTIESEVATNYAAVIEAQNAGQVDIASYGPFSYVTARDSGVDIFPAAVAIDEEGQSNPSYVSYLVVPADSEIQSIDELAGRTVCFVDPTSTSGYLYPSAGLLEAGIDPEEDVEPVFAGGHDASVLSVVSGSCDAGFAFDDMVDSVLIDSGDISEGDVRVIWQSADIPASPIAVHNQVGEDMAAQIQDILVNKINVGWLTENGYCTSEEDCALPEDAWGYIAGEDSFYDGIREVCDITQSDACAA